jgi:hypothetical protein
MSLPLRFAGLFVLLEGAALVSCSKADPGVVEVANGSDDDEEDDTAGDEDDDTAGDDGDECELGEERCECRSNERCDEGLVCLSGLCVEVEAGDDDQDSDDDSDDEPAADDDAEAEPADEPKPVDDDLAIPVEPGPSPAADDDAEPESEPDSEPEPDAEGGAGGAPAPSDDGSGGVTIGDGGEGPVGVGGQVSVGGQPSSGGAGPVNPADNLISNGDFSSGGDDWKVDDSATAVAYTTTSGALCVTLDSYQPYIAVGWPLDETLAVTLDPAVGYELSYDARASNTVYLLFEAKVGEAFTPYAPQFSAPVEVSSQMTRYSHTFIPAYSSPSGVVFLLDWYYTFYGPSSEVCIDNVVLRAL